MPRRVSGVAAGFIPALARRLRPKRGDKPRGYLPIALLCLLTTGCAIDRRLRLESDPPGALVYLNGEEVARTPATVPLDWYGRYDITARLDGHETLRTRRWVAAPWWLWPPLDLVAELLPVPLSHTAEIELDLKPAGEAKAGLVDRAVRLRRATATRPAS